MYDYRDKRGVALIFTFIVLVSLTLIVLAFVAMVTYETRSAGTGLQNMQAFYIAEAGRAKARWALTTGEEDVGWGESDVQLGYGTYTVTTTDNGDDTYTIQSDGYIPDDTNPIAKRRVIERNVPVTAGSGNISSGATASASSQQGGHPASHAIDGNTSTFWQASANNDAWFKLDFGSSTAFNQVVINGQANINSAAIYYSANNIDYYAVANLVESPAWTFSFDLVSSRYLRFNMDVDSNKKAKINEFETYQTGYGSTTLGQGEFVTSW